VTPARLRPRAEADLVERTRYYLLNAGDDVATRFFDSAIAALEAIERMPGTGSPRVGALCDIPGLRVRRIAGFPCGWFYFDRKDHVDAARLLADAQELAAVLTGLDDCE
jgi:toxin ParE1/3/4